MTKQHIFKILPILLLPLFLFQSACEKDLSYQPTNTSNTTNPGTTNPPQRVEDVCNDACENALRCNFLERQDLASCRQNCLQDAEAAACVAEAACDEFDRCLQDDRDERTCERACENLSVCGLIPPDDINECILQCSNDFPEIECIANVSCSTIGSCFDEPPNDETIFCDKACSTLVDCGYTNDVEDCSFECSRAPSGAECIAASVSCDDLPLCFE